MDKSLIDRVNNIYWKYDIKPQVINSPLDAAVLTSISSFGKDTNRGPIGITSGIFNGTEVTVMFLGGTQIKEGQATRMVESKLASSGKENDYLKAVLDIFSRKENNKDIISKDKKIIIFGISLGGMIAQQLIGIDKIIDNYKIESIICFGSPVTRPLNRKGIRVKRFTDKGDIVPKLGKIVYRNRKDRNIIKELDKEELILEDGKYKKRIECHALSYVSNKDFLKYDFYGEENGNNKLEITSEIKFYDAPITENQKGKEN